jgi:TonB family protein
VKQLAHRGVRRFSLSKHALSVVLTLLCLAGGVGQTYAQTASKSKRKVVVEVAPDYPYVLRNGHFEGQVRLEATVLPNGTVTKVEPKGGNPMLSEYAQRAVMRWKYAPGPAQTVEDVVFTFNANK